MALNLRKPVAKQPAQPPAPKPPASPLAPGTVIAGDGKGGFKPAGLLAGDAKEQPLAQRAAAARKAIEEDTAAAIEEMVAKGKPLAPPAVVPLSSQPARKQQEVQAAIKLAQEQLAALPPHLQQAAAAAAPATEAPADTATPAAPLEGYHPDEEPLGDGGDLANCPHCNWPLATAEPGAAADDDKIKFVTAVLGDQPFLKTYLLLGGRLKITYRTPSASMSEMVMQQLAIDKQHSRNFTVDDVWRLVWDYRFVFGLHSIERVGVVTDVAAAVDEVLADPGDARDGETPLPSLLRSLQAQPVFATESLWRISTQNFRRFNDLCELLEARADDPSFYQAIGS